MILHAWIGIIRSQIFVLLVYYMVMKYLNSLEKSLGLADLHSFSSEHLKRIRSKITSSPEETFDELTFYRKLSEGGCSNLELEFEYVHDARGVARKSVDIKGTISRRQILFEVKTRRTAKRIPGIQHIDRMHLKNLQSDYEKKKVDEANLSGSLSGEPVIFVVNTGRSLPQVFLSEGGKYLHECRYLAALIFFNGYVFSGENVAFRDPQIYFLPRCVSPLEKDEDEFLARMLWGEAPQVSR